MIALTQQIPYPVYTTTERDALTGVLNGMRINNSTTGTEQVYNGSTWEDVIYNTSLSQTNYLYVAKNGNNTTGNGSIAKPYLTINAAISIATAGTTIFVFPGTYTENITFKAGVNIISPVLRGVTISGNHIANHSGTVVVSNCVLSSTTGVTLTISGSSATLLQLYDSSSNSGTGDAIVWTNTNASSRLNLSDSTVNVATSGATARAFYSTTGAAGSVIADGVSFELNNTDNVCLAIGGAINFVHTSDVVDGTIVVSGTASYIGSMNRNTSATQPTLTTNSSSMSVLMDCVQVGTAIPMVAGAGLFSEAAIVYASTGKGTASTLNGGAGAYILNQCSLKLRAGTLKPVPQDGLMEYDGVHSYFTVGSTRYQLDQQGGGGITIIDKTHAQLLAMKTAGTLVPGQLYNITDHITKHLIPNTTEIRSADAIEPLIVLATSVNTIDKEAYSVLYPKDIIHYDIDDTSCEDGTWDVVLQRYTGGTARKGKITYRKDTINELETHYDWRNVKFRRWAVSAVVWVSGNPYVKMDVALGSDGNIYFCKVASTSGIIDPSVDTINWQLWLDITTQTAFWSWTSVISNFGVGGITTTNLIINNVTPGTDYNDYYTFCITGELTNSSGSFEFTGLGFRQFILKSVLNSIFYFNTGIDITYNNVVFYLTNEIYENSCFSNTFDKGCFNSTIIGDYFQKNIIGTYFGQCTIGNGFYLNTIGTNFQSNTIGTNFQSNAITDSFQENKIRDYFIGNEIGGSFYSNIIGGSFASNTIGSGFILNTIGDYFQTNATGSNFISSIIEDTFQSNIIGSSFTSNAIGNNFTSNVVGSNFSQITVADNAIQNTFSSNLIFLDFTLATHIYGLYDCEIFKRQDETVKLRYTDNSDALVVVSPTA